MKQSEHSIATCLCGASKLHVTNRSNKSGACHCGMCRRWAGGPFMAVHCESDQVILEPNTPIKVYDSSQWAERGFCSECGSNLFYRLKPTQAYYISSGLFEDQKSLELAHQVYIDHKPDFYEFSNQTPTMTEAEILAAFAPQP